MNGILTIFSFPQIFTSPHFQSIHLPSVFFPPALFLQDINLLLTLYLFTHKPTSSPATKASSFFFVTREVLFDDSKGSYCCLAFAGR
jgi:hypothetical protein